MLQLAPLARKPVRNRRKLRRYVAHAVEERGTWPGVEVERGEVEHCRPAAKRWVSAEPSTDHPMAYMVVVLALLGPNLRCRCEMAGFFLEPRHRRSESRPPR